MEFSLTGTQSEISKAGRSFARKEIESGKAREFDKASRFPADIHKKAAELGFTSIYFDEACLGGGLGFFENSLMAEALCRQDSTLGMAVMMSTFGSELLQCFCSQALKRQFLTPVAKGDWICGAVFPPACFEQVNDRSAVFALKRGGGWRWSMSDNVSSSGGNWLHFR
jgi:alkylation response protein AidB-like acyl-CoA dehydrogenase